MNFKPAVQSPTAHFVTFDPVTMTLRPRNGEGDAFFGLEMGTNGTAAVMRRQIAEIAYVPKNQRANVRWVRADGKSQPLGITLKPTAHSDLSFVSPWSGQ